MHPLVRAALSLREVSDFDLLGKVFETYQKVAKESSGVEKLAALQEANRCAVEARHGEHRSKLIGPDNDSVLESIAGMIRSQKPNLGLAEQRLREVLGNDPSNSDAWVLRCEWMEATNAEQKAVEAVWDEAIVAAPVPEVFHRMTSQCIADETDPL